ncbi:glycoside hydrolase family 16 protein [Sphaerobolus stellatus SS14]|uniref:Unplaced genomic scaffold SPHSTscaffold_78, whole genome shotgun sequence n=1 Tax=Sphaerobolus stellatus (strain SS14) TaxID=990650 RepID=A0A0C9VNP3_SPHS4|nr:glycoside hydrolase family 16 protein [Sphaerobolus stellatus SS14]
MAVNQQEPDDYLHNPDPKRDRKNDKGGTILTTRGIANLGCLFILVAGLTTLFAGYPLITYFTRKPTSTLGAFNLGGTNASGQVPELIGHRALVDPATPTEALTKVATDGSTWDIVFSDEFETPGRSFYPGDDPYWEAVDLHYWQTNNLECNGGVLSYLQGQRLSACTCPDESHPGPRLPDGRLRGRAAPEIDIFEAQVDTTRMVGTVSQSGQWAPFNNEYTWDNTTENPANLVIYNATITELNAYKGGAFQQATSGLSITNQTCYTQGAAALAGENCFAVYGYEYLPDREKGYITWINNDEPAWTINAAGMGPDPIVEIGQRIIPEEPMYIIMNLGISENFGFVDFANLVFPTEMRVDWVRVYQPKGKTNIGCDPPDYPTQAYINTYIEAYTNPNLTTWVDDYKQTFPKNNLTATCN